ncbi:MAG: glycosyltransferase family 1 protein [Nitrospirae bacterium]|nr:glycosyltransferase family 1 protein [Nitrospirota bacterium]
MVQGFIFPAGLVGRFAVIKLWPEIKTAEDECIARLKIAAAALGLECIEIHADGRLLEEATSVITKKDVDFVIHLHYDTPKLYDVFSFVALWNPVQFYHVWGYPRCTRNLLSHDDFISCSSPAADDHVGRVVRRVATHLPPFFNLYHSIVDVVHPPSLGDHKLFYSGMNWEALGGGKSRHQELLKRLDQTGALRIYGPRIFQGVKVWSGYDSYVGEIPFDGVSMMDEIAKAGIALVLSSPDNKQSELMSSRLFESVAAGALVICDENKFAEKHFSDSLLYIDTRCSVDKICHDILKHVAWAKTNADQALEMMAKAQGIFRQKFTLNKNLKELYLGFSERKLALLKHQNPDGGVRINVRLYLLLLEYSDTVLNTHIASVVAQEYDHFSAVLIIDKTTASENRSGIEAALAKSSVPIDVLEIDFFSYGPNREIKTRRRVGEVIGEVLGRTSQTDAVVFVAPNEKLFSNHLQVLTGSLARNPDKNCAATSAILKCGNQPIHGIHERIDFRCLNPAAPNGYARFIFRVSAFPDDLGLALPYLDRKALAILVGENVICQEIPSTVIMDIENEFPSDPWDEGQENAVISDIFPAAFAIYTGYETILPTLPSQVAPAANVLRLVSQLLSWRWVVAQARALRRQGLAARLIAVKRKLKKKMTE